MRMFLWRHGDISKPNTGALGNGLLWVGRASHRCHRGHRFKSCFWATLHLYYLLSPHAKLFTWKWVWFPWQWPCRGNKFSCEQRPGALGNGLLWVGRASHRCHWGHRFESCFWATLHLYYLLSPHAKLFTWKCEFYSHDSDPVGETNFHMNRGQGLSEMAYCKLVEHRSGVPEVMGSNPVEALIFQASSFQLLK